jgi:hypothetical protein
LAWVDAFSVVDRFLAGWAETVSVQESDLCGTDFIVFYAGGKLVGTDQLYTVPAVAAIQKQEMGCTNPSAIFIRLPYFALLMWPWARIPFWTSFALWRVANCIAVGIFVWLWPARKEWLLLACAWSLPLAYNLFNGQDIGFLLMWLAVSRFLLFDHRARVGAGLSLSLCSAKFHLFLLVPFLFKRDLKVMACGFAIGTGFILALCFAVQGHSWPRQFLAAATDPRIDPAPAFLVNLRGLSHGSGSLQLLLSTWIAVALFFIFLKGDFSYRLSSIIIGGILLTQHQTFSDLALLIPVAFMLATHPQAKYSRWVAIFLISPVATVAMFSATSYEDVPRVLFFLLPLLMFWELKNGRLRATGPTEVTLDRDILPFCEDMEQRVRPATDHSRKSSVTRPEITLPQRHCDQQQLGLASKIPRASE